MKQYLEPRDYEIAERNGIKKNVLYQRFYILGWSFKRATTQPPERDLAKWVKIAVENGITESVFYRRVSKGMDWSPEKAATVPVRKKRKCDI